MCHCTMYLEMLHVLEPFFADITCAPRSWPRLKVEAPTGAATDVIARFPADGGWFLELRKVDGRERLVTDEAVAIAA